MYVAMYVFICLCVVKLDTLVFWAYNQLAALPALYNTIKIMRTHANIPIAPYVDIIIMKLALYV